MSMVLNGKYSNEPTIKFYTARALRIFPLYLLVLVLTLWFLSAIGKSSSRPFNDPGMAIRDPGKRHDNRDPMGDQLGLCGDSSRLEPRHRTPVLSRGSLHSHASTMDLRSPSPGARLLCGFPCSLRTLTWLFTSPRADWCFFMLGAAAHRLGLLVPKGRIHNVLGWCAAALLPIAGFLSGLPITTDLDRPALWLFYLLFAASIPFIFSISMGSRIDRLLGDLSYPIYVVHWFVISFVGHFSGFFYR